MAIQNTSLRPIAIEYLYDGFVLNDTIYNYNGKTMLLPKGEVLTQHKIAQLKKFNKNNRNICVTLEVFQKLIKRNMLPKAIEDKIGYTGMVKETFSLLKTVQTSNVVPQKEVYELSNTISERTLNADPALIFQCINTIRPYDEYLYRHSINVSMINGLMGKWLKLPKKEIELLMLAGLVHDLGKVKIPQEILEAPRKLTKEEFLIIKKHPLYSYALLSGADNFDDRVKLAARHHHEKMDGTGYPDQIKGNEISMFAKITAISDVYDAMVSSRSYKTAVNPFLILSQFAKNQFTGLDLPLSAIFVQNMPSNLLHKNVLMSNGTIGKIALILPNDLEHPIVNVDGVIQQSSEECSCVQMIFDE